MRLRCSLFMRWRVLPLGTAVAVGCFAFSIVAGNYPSKIGSEGSPPTSSGAQPGTGAKPIGQVNLIDDTGRDNDWTRQMRLAQVSSSSDLPAGAFDTGSDKVSSKGSKKLKDKPSSSRSDNPENQLRLGIETRKALQMPDYLRRSDCETDEECADYSGLSKSTSPKTTVKNLRPPFIGLSITAPLQ
jgi:hypothetical protein